MFKFLRKKQEPESNLVTYARKELALAGLYDQDSDYGGMLGDAALEIIKVFAKQGHSGFSASMTTDIVAKLMRYAPLTPLTYGPEEWNEVGEGVWQNNRKSSVFSDDGGKTHYDIDDPTNDTRVVSESSQN